MSAKDNFNQAMSDMFGSTKTETETPAPQTHYSYEPYQEAPVTRMPSTYLAVGTVVEGTIRSNGDVEIAGILKGDIEAKGRVTLHTDVKGNVTASELSIPSCNLIGDVECTGKVTIGSSATINGNIHAEEVTCLGRITGDVITESNIALQNTAIVNGHVTTVTMSMEKGAIFRGGIEMVEPPAPEFDEPQEFYTDEPVPTDESN